MKIEVFLKNMLYFLFAKSEGIISIAGPNLTSIALCHQIK